MIPYPRFPWMVSLVVCGAVAVAAAEPSAWIERSDVNARYLLQVGASFSPESAARSGLPGYDDQISDFSPGYEARVQHALTTARDELQRRAATETDPLVRQDLGILLRAAGNQIETSVLEQRLMVPYANVAQIVFFGEFSLLEDQVAAERRPHALVRLRKYTGLEPGTKPITRLVEAWYEAGSRNPALVQPYKGEVESHLADIPRFAAGIRQLYVKQGLDKLPGATAALDALDAQLKEYGEWLRSTVLPKARTDARLPAELYADNLKNIGLDIPPQELMRKAETAFAEIRNEMNALAPLVAKAEGLPTGDYRTVIRELKKSQLTRAEVEPWYHEVIANLETIIRRERIVSLPARPLKLRLASEAETAAQPAPHFQPPPLLGAKNEQGVFVLTASNPGADGKETKFDDFTFRAGAWTLTAHEGRPGHDLQFTAMVERGVSLARSLFAFNSVNVEGWALYAEAEAKPYEPIDGQLIALQHRLMRAARAFLDPMLNLGLITREQAFRVLTEDVCLSDGLATEEVDRYMFRMPGQATAYFYGYSRLMELRAATEIELGPKFDRMTFNDFIIDQGLLPPELLAKAVHETFIPARLRDAPTK